MITINKAEINQGAVVVNGKEAVANAEIFWEGDITKVTTANGKGAFNFTTTNLPVDCVGILTSGASSGSPLKVVIANCGAHPLKTGQTSDFGSGSDGILQKGTARSYTDNGATITDNSTGLVWEKLGSLDGTENFTDPHDADNYYTWADAFAKIAALNTVPCFAGQCDWRLPNINELLTLVDWGQIGPAINQTFFNNGGVDSFTQSSFYWSSTTYLSGPGNAWVVNFADGFVSADGKGLNGYVRAVRGGS